MENDRLFEKCKIDSILEGFKDSRVLVIGDIMLDEYVKGLVDRISPEAPVPVLRVVSEEYLPGGAANVANNVISLGGHADVIGIMGNDFAGDRLYELLEKSSIGAGGVVKDYGCKTTQKTRLIAHTQHITRVDRENGKHNSFDRLCASFDERIEHADIVVVSDYCKGVVDERMMTHIRDVSSKYHVPVIVDPKPPHSDIYRGVSAITPNIGEAEKLSGLQHNEWGIDPIGHALVEMLETDVIITRGEHGMSVYRFEQDAVHLPADARQVYDVSGAGDTVIATLGLCMASGMSLSDSARIANYAAGIVVEKLGTATVTPDELKKRVLLRNYESRTA